MPELPAADLAQWLYAHRDTVRVTGPAHQILTLPEPAVLVELLRVAADGDARWVLLDGPRQQRPVWLLDPWWQDAPEMSPRLLELTQARCCALDELLQALAQLG